MSRAKEGSRTPTRVTPLEPERTAFDGFQGKTSGVVQSERRQDSAGNGTYRQNTGACTAIAPAQNRRGLNPRKVVVHQRDRDIATWALECVAKRAGVEPELVLSNGERGCPRVVLARREWWLNLYGSGWSTVHIARVTGFDRTSVMKALRKELAA